MNEELKGNREKKRFARFWTHACILANQIKLYQIVRDKRTTQRWPNSCRERETFEWEWEREREMKKKCRNRAQPALISIAVRDRAAVLLHVSLSHSHSQWMRMWFYVEFTCGRSVNSTYAALKRAQKWEKNNTQSFTTTALIQSPVAHILHWENISGIAQKSYLCRLIMLKKSIAVHF